MYSLIWAIMYHLKGYDFLAVLIRNRVWILAILVSYKAWFLHSYVLGMFFFRTIYFFVIIDHTTQQTPFPIPFNIDVN